MIDGGLTDAQKAALPGARRLHRAARRRTAGCRRACCKGQLAVAQRDAGGTLTAFTGVQIPGVLDDLYADAVADATLGVTFKDSKPTFRLWAPTAQSRDPARRWERRRRPATRERHEATWDAASGIWTVDGAKSLKGDEYLWEVAVYAPTTGEIETNAVTDPYSVALTTNSERSVAIDLDDKALRARSSGRRRRRR